MSETNAVVVLVKLGVFAAYFTRALYRLIYLHDGRPDRTRTCDITVMSGSF